MKRTEAREKQMHRMIIAGWSILIICELLVASIPAALAAKILFPLGRAVRGYEAFGVEHLIVAAIFCIAYAFVHKYACDRIFEEG